MQIGALKNFHHPISEGYRTNRTIKPFMSAHKRVPQLLAGVLHQLLKVTRAPAAEDLLHLCVTAGSLRSANTQIHSCRPETRFRVTDAQRN